VKTSVLVRILLIIVLLTAIVISLLSPSEAIEKATGGRFHKWTAIAALAICILILIFGPKCVHYFLTAGDSETDLDIDLPPGIEKCQFCSKAIGRAQTPYVIKNHIVCEQCYKMIKDEAKKAT